MIINSIGLKNIKSYGNNRQVITFDNIKPQLILLSGRNGSGKSTILEAIDLALFGKVKGKNKKTVATTSLPNRMNLNLEVDLDFINNQNQNIIINKHLSPNLFKITLNNQDYTDRFNILNETEKEKLLEFNFDTFKSFISMNVNDFGNFIELQATDKRNLINKLFNIEKLDNYISVIADIIKNDEIYINNCNSNITNNNKIITENKNIINNIKKTEAELNSNRLLNIKSEASLLTIDFDLKKTQLAENTEVESSKLSELNELKSKLSILKQEKQKLENDIYIKKEKLLFLNNDVCPYCDSKLEDENNKETLKIEISNIEYDLDLINKNITDVITQGNKINIEYKNILQIKKELSINIDSLRSDINNLKKEYLYLSDKKDIVQSEIIEYINKLELENKILEDNILLREDKIRLYKELLLVLDSPTGVRVELLKNLLPSINEYIIDFLDFINFKYTVKLDQNFDAMIFERKYNKISSESLSNGEMKIINIIIALSYIKMIKKIKNVNILFLDELFTTIDLEYIDLFLKLLKKLSLELNLNIIVVHHEIMEDKLYNFDRIIKMTNTMFTQIEDKLI